MLTKILIILYKIIKPKDIDKFFEQATNTVLLIANILDVLIIILMALYVDKLVIVLYAVILAMLIRVDMGEHYDTWFECLVSGLLIYALYAFTSIMIDSLIIDIILGIVLAVFMIDFKSKKAQKIIRRIIKKDSS